MSILAMMKRDLERGYGVNRFMSHIESDLIVQRLVCEVFFKFLESSFELFINFIKFQKKILVFATTLSGRDNR